MNVQSFLRTIDGISTWVGKAAAWLIIGLMTLVCVEVFKRYILNAPTVLDLRRRQHDVRHAVHVVRRLSPRAKRPCPRRLPVQLDASTDAGGARHCAVRDLLRSGHRGADLCRLRL